MKQFLILLFFMLAALAALYLQLQAALIILGSFSFLALVLVWTSPKIPVRKNQ